MIKGLLIFALTALHSTVFASWNPDATAKALATATLAARSMAQISAQSRAQAKIQAESYSPGAQEMTRSQASMMIQVPVVTSIPGVEQFSEVYHVKIEPDGTVASVELTEDVDP